MSSSATATSGFSCAALSSIASCEQAKREAVVDGAQDAGGVAERERVLQVARASGLPQVRALQQRPHARAAPHDAGVGSRQRDRRVEGGGVGGEGLPIERGRDRARIEQAQRVGQRERRQPGAERVVVDQRDALLGGQGHVAADAVGEVGQRAEIALARGAEQPHARRLVGVQRIDDAREQLGAHAGGALGEAVREPQHGGAHDLARCVGAGRHAVIAQQAAVVGVHLAGGRRSRACARRRRSSRRRRPRGARPRARRRRARPGRGRSHRRTPRPARRRGRRARRLRA